MSAADGGVTESITVCTWVLLWWSNSLCDFAMSHDVPSFESTEMSNMWWEDRYSKVRVGAVVNAARTHNQWS